MPTQDPERSLTEYIHRLEIIQQRLGGMQPGKRRPAALRAVSSLGSSLHGFSCILPIILRECKKHHFSERFIFCVGGEKIKPLKHNFVVNRTSS